MLLSMAILQWISKLYGFIVKKQLPELKEVLLKMMEELEKSKMDKEE